MASIVPLVRWIMESEATGWVVAAAVSVLFLCYFLKKTIEDNRGEHEDIRRRLDRIEVRFEELYNRRVLLEAFQRGEREELRRDTTTTTGGRERQSDSIE